MRPSSIGEPPGRIGATTDPSYVIRPVAITGTMQLGTAVTLERHDHVVLALTVAAVIGLVRRSSD